MESLVRSRGVLGTLYRGLRGALDNPAKAPDNRAVIRCEVRIPMNLLGKFLICP